jgi:putative transposase
MSSDRRRRTDMPRKRPTPEEIVSKLRQVDVLVSQGKSVADAVRAIGMTEVTYYLYGRLSHCKPILN